MNKEIVFVGVAFTTGGGHKDQHRKITELLTSQGHPIIGTFYPNGAQVDECGIFIDVYFKGVRVGFGIRVSGTFEGQRTLVKATQQLVEEGIKLHVAVWSWDPDQHNSRPVNLGHHLNLHMR